MENDEFENKYVHDFYNHKAQKFSNSRVKPWPFTVNFMSKYVKDHFLLLDAGCGNGRQFMHQNTIGLDFSENLLLDAREKPNIGLIKASVISLPFKSASFDVLLSIAVIHHLSSHERRIEAMNEIKRVLKPKAYCLLYVWHKDASIKSKFERYNENCNEYLVSWSGEKDKLRYYCLFDEDMLKDLAKETGMPIVR